MNELDTLTNDTIHIIPDTALMNQLSTIKAQQPFDLPHSLHTPFFDDGILILLTITLIVLGSIVTTSGNYIITITNSIFNRQTAQRLFRERFFNVANPVFRLDIVYFATLGLFFFHAMQYFLSSSELPHYLYILILILCSVLFVFTKYSLYYFTGFIFEAQNQVNEYVYNSKTSNRVLGLFLLPTAIFLCFTEGIFNNILLFFGFFTMLFFSLIKLFRGLQIIAQKDFSISYLILYLCTLEILPILIVWRILSRM